MEEKNEIIMKEMKFLHDIPINVIIGYQLVMGPNFPLLVAK